MTDHALDPAQQVELPHTERRGLGHRRDDGGIDAQHHAAVFEPQEQVVERRRVGGRGHDVGGEADRHCRVGLHEGTVEHPRIAWAHPDDAVGIDPVQLQPHDRIGRRLARARDHVLTRCVDDVRELTDRDHARTVAHTERCRGGRGNRRREVRGVHHAAARVDPDARTRHVRRHDVIGTVALVLARRQELHPPRTEEAPVEDVVEVGLDLRAPGSLLQPGLRAVLLDRAGPEHGRRDAVEQRRLVQLHERIRVLPVPAGGVAAVDQGDMHVGVVDQRVGERHAHRACTHDQVIGVEASHRRQS